MRSGTSGDFPSSDILRKKHIISILVRVAGNETGLEVLIKLKHMFMSRDQKTRRIHKIKTHNKSFEEVEQFKYLGTTVRNQYYIQEETKIKIKECSLSFSAESFVF